MNFYQILKLNKMIKNPTLKLVGILGASWFGVRHLSIRFDPVLGCNLECRMCYFSNPVRRKELKGRMSLDEIRQMAKCLFPRALQVVVGCGAEPTIHKDYVEIIRLAKHYGVPDISMVTNGMLMSFDDMDQLVQVGLNELILSMHGVSKTVYEHFMQKADYDEFIKRLDWLTQLKQKHQSKLPALRINYTVNADNLDDLQHFFERFGHLDISTLQIRPMFEIDGIYHRIFDAEQEKWYNDIVNQFKDIAKERHMRLLANMIDVHYKHKSKDAKVAAAVYCYVSPRTASQLGLSWDKMTFRQYNRLSGRRQAIWRSIFTSGAKFAANIDKSDIY